MANTRRTPTQAGKQHPMTGFFGDTHYIDEDALYAQILLALYESKTSHAPVHISDFIPMGTDEEKEDIAQAIKDRISNDPDVEIAIWTHQAPKDSPPDTTTYAVRQPDGTFRQETMEAIVGGLVSGRQDTLETRGSITDQREFFAKVRAFIATITVNQGFDVKEEGAVTYKETWEHNVLATLESLEQAFENMVLEGMEPVPQEDDLVNGLNEMDVD